MDTQRTMSLAAPCPRCGRKLHDDWELGQLAEAALDALERMKLCIPGGVKVCLELVRNEMACRVGVCRR